MIVVPDWSQFNLSTYIFFQSSKAIILPGEMKFWQFHKRSLEKFWLWQDLNLCLLDTRWVLWSAMKPHNLGPMHILEGFSFPWRNLIKIFTSLKNWNLFLAYTVVIFIKNGLLLYFQFLIFRNGHFLGVAFDNVQYGPGLAYFPAASLSYGESCHMNFGSAPFKYPFDKQRKTKQNK